MSFLKYQFRRFIRNNMRPISPDRAQKTLVRLQWAYFIAGLIGVSSLFAIFSIKREAIEAHKGDNCRNSIPKLTNLFS